MTITYPPPPLYLQASKLNVWYLANINGQSKNTLRKGIHLPYLPKCVKLMANACMLNRNGVLISTYWPFGSLLTVLKCTRVASLQTRLDEAPNVNLLKVFETRLWKCLNAFGKCLKTFGKVFESVWPNAFQTLYKRIAKCSNVSKH